MHSIDPTPTVAPEVGWPPFPDDAAVVVTGAGSGIGRATAMLAASLGLQVALWGRDLAKLAAVADELADTDAHVVVTRVDVTNTEEVDAGFAAAVDAFTHIDYLVNNAGPSSQVQRPFDDGMMAVMGSVESVTSRWCDLERRPGDAVVNVGSIAGPLVGGGGQAWYPASKGAVSGYTKFLAAERPGGIRANAVAPANVATPRLAGFLAGERGQEVMAKHPLGRAGRPEEVATAIMFLLSPAASYINGAMLVVDGGSTVSG